MKIQILRNNYEDINVSMKTYADGLVKSLRSFEGCPDILEVSVKSRFPDMGFTLFKKLKNYYERYILYPRALKHTHPDIYHIVDHSFAYLLKHLEDKKTVVTCHDLIVLKLLRGDFKGFKAPKLASCLFKSSIRHLKKASRIISVSENTKKDLIELLSIPAEKITVIHNGIDHELFKPSENQKRKEEFTVVHVGGNWFYKNVEAVINAIALLKNDLKTRVKFLRVGACFTKAQTELISKLGLRNRVQAIPAASGEEIAEKYRQADLLVFPSLYEGFGLPPLEAMACGLPVIASGAASLPEVLGDSAIYIDPYDFADIAKAIEKALLDGQLRKNLIEKGLKRAKMFGWDRAAKETLGVYTETLAS